MLRCVNFAEYHPSVRARAARRMLHRLSLVINQVRSSRCQAPPFGSTSRMSSSDKEPTLHRERLWQESLTDPPQWWDQRKNNKNPKAPDFRHKSTEGLLWVDSCYNPGWVKDMLQKKEAQKGGSQGMNAVKPSGGLARQEQACSISEDPGFADELGRSGHMHKASFRSGVQVVASKSQQLLEGNGWEMLSLEEAFINLDQMAELPSVENFICILQKCRKEKNLAYAKRLHAHICSNGLEAHRAVGNYIVPMFVECGSMLDAQQVFNRLVHRNEHSWTSLISGYIQCGHSQQAFNLYQKMQEDSICPSRYTLMALLKACARLKDAERGREVHFQICQKGFEKDIFVGSTLVNMYAKCGLLSEAWEVFNKLPVRDVVSWNALIAGYAERRLGQEALKCFEQMQLEGVSPNAVSFICILKTCSSIGAIDKGREIHMEITQKGFERHLFVGNTLVDMYAKCGSLSEALVVFDKLPVRDVVSWNALIAGYAEHGPGQDALKCFEQMQLEDISPDALTFVFTLKACGSIGAIDKGRKIHADITQKGFERNIFVGNTLVDMYAKCGSLLEAQEVFDKLPVRDVVSWSALIAGYAEYGSGQDALKCFDHMQLVGVSPDAITFVCILKACGSIGAINKGREIHREIMQMGFERDIFVGNTLVDMYAKCGSLLEALEVFDKLPVRNVVSWSALIAGYSEHGRTQDALKCFEQMQLEGVHPDVVPWNALIAGYTKHGAGLEVLKCFEQMQLEGVSPNAVTFVCCLKACASIGAIDKGREIHAEIAQLGFESDLFVGSTLVDMYAKCGSLSEAQEVFEKLPVRDVVSWNAMINGYGMNHEGNMAIRSFEDMREHGVMPNAITFTCLLTACSRASLVFKGQEYFKVMREEYGIAPTTDHYTCMVDLFARSGHLYEAEKFLESTPCPPSIETWKALLSACKTYGEAELGLRCFQQLVQMNPEIAVSYVLMASIYASAGRRDDAYRIEELRKLAGAKKKPASALIEVNKKMHEFVVGSNQSKEIAAMLEILSSRMKEEGHVPNLDMVLRPIPDEEKETALCEHAEKLAVAFGLLNTPQGQTLRVIKNMRMCNNCHNANKIISRIERREIIVRDSYCVHHFKDNLCSCTLVF